MSRGFKNVDLKTGCHSYIHGIDTAYGYTPSMAAGIVFCVLFGLSMCVHTAQFVWKRTWWCAVFSVGCLSMRLSLPRYHRANLLQPAELIGWAGRTWSADCPYNMTAFMMQISTLIIGKPISSENTLPTGNTTANLTNAQPPSSSPPASTSS
jgi:tellurite resistance protein TehA-like permease